MKRTHLGNLKMFLTLVFLLGLSYASWAENFIVNPGFEDDGLAGIPPSGWTRPTGTTFETSNEQVFGGGYSGKIYTSTSTARSTVSTPFSVSGDSTYEWFAHVYDNNPTVKGYVKIFWYDSTGGSISNVSLGAASGDSLIWQYRFDTISAPSDARTAKVRCYIDGVGSGPYNGAVYFDDVSFGTGSGGEHATIATLDPTEIGSTSAILNLSYTMGDAHSADVYFQRKQGTTWTEITGSRNERNSTSSLSYSYYWLGLDAGTTYTIRAGLDDGTSSYYGVEKSFTALYADTGNVKIDAVYGNAAGSDNSYECLRLYNPTRNPIPLGGYKIYKPTGDLQVTIPEGKIIPPRGTFLIADAGWESGDTPRDGRSAFMAWPTADLLINISIVNSSSGLRLDNAAGIPIDAVGWGACTAGYFETTPLPVTSLPETTLWKRKLLNPGSADSTHQDTNNNTLDFERVIMVNIKEQIKTPQNFSLIIFPNPFNISTSISYEISNSEQVDLKIYNLMGQVVKTLVNKYQQQGKYNLIWNGTDKNSQAVSSGVYFCRLTQKSESQLRRMFLLK